MPRKFVTLSSLDFLSPSRQPGDNNCSRNRFQGRCKKEARRSKRRIGPSFCKQASPRRMRLRGKHSLLLVKYTGRLFTLSFDVAATRRLTRKISSKVSLFIYLNTTR